MIMNEGEVLLFIYNADPLIAINRLAILNKYKCQTL